MTLPSQSNSAGGLEQQQYLTFKLGGEVFAIGILNTREIIDYNELTTVPMMPSFVRGVINLRGSMVPILDLSTRFGRGETAVGRRTSIVICEFKPEDETAVRTFGIIVDAVSEVLDIPAAAIEPAPTFKSSARSEFIAGMGKVAGEFVIILRVDRILAEDEVAALGQLSSP